MLAKTITYTDLNGQSQTETLYFNFNQREAAAFIDSIGGDYDAYASKILSTGRVSDIIDFITNILLDAYGQKSEDGKRFIKNAKIRAEFADSIAFAEITEQFLMDPKFSEEFGQELVSSIKRPTEKAATKVDPEVLQQLQAGTISVADVVKSINNQNDEKVVDIKQSMPNPAKMDSKEQDEFAQFLAWKASQQK